MAVKSSSFSRIKEFSYQISLKPEQRVSPESLADRKTDLLSKILRMGQTIKETHQQNL